MSSHLALYDQMNSNSVTLIIPMHRPPSGLVLRPRPYDFLWLKRTAKTLYPESYTKTYADITKKLN